MRRVEDVAIRRRDHRPPLGVRRLDAEAEESEAGDLEHGGGEPERRLDDQRGQRVGEHPVREQPAVAHAEGAVGGDEVLLADRQHLAAYDTGVGGHADDGDRQHAVDQAAAEHRDDEDRQQQRRERQQHVHAAHQHVVEAAPEEPGDESDRRAEDDGDGDGAGAGDERDAGAEDDPAELVPAVLVEAHQVLHLGCRGSRTGGRTASPALRSLAAGSVSTSLGPYGAISGANTARPTINMASARPTRPDHERRNCAEDVAPTARRRHRHVRVVGAGRRRGQFRRAGDDVEVRSSSATHVTRTRGSDSVYSRSVIRLTKTKETPTTRAKPCTTA